MFIVGLTGGLATGKSTVLSIFRDNGIGVIDADEVARKVLEPGTKGWMELREYFGEEVLSPEGKVNRARLGEIVFDNIEKRRKLNAITHPRIQSAMIRMAMSYFFSGHRYIVMEVPLLFETGKMLTFMHKIITVVCEDHQQLERLCKRSDFSEVVAKKRINCQMPLEDKVAKSHFVIDNSGNITNTRNQTESIIRVLRRSKFTWNVPITPNILCTKDVHIVFCETYKESLAVVRNLLTVDTLHSCHQWIPLWYFRAIFFISLLSVVFGVAHIVSNMVDSKK